MRCAVSLLALIYFNIIHIGAARQDKIDRKGGVSVFIYSPPKEARGSGLDAWIKNQQKALKRLKRPIIRQTLDGRFVKDEVEGILLLTEEGSNEVFVPEELIVSTKKLLTFVQQQLKNNESFIDERNPVRRDTGNSEVKGKAFSFQYIVDDELTQNFQTRQEEGDVMGVVKGCYQLLEPDGMVRTVIYQADSFGFKIVSASKGPDKVPCSGSSDEGFQTPFQKTFNQTFGGKALSSSNTEQAVNRTLPKTQHLQKQVTGSSKSIVSPTKADSQKNIQSSESGSKTVSQKEDAIVSYINNLSETLFQSFKSVDSKDVSNYINFPFVLIPISTFLQLRQDGHIDDEVQGFGAVIQNLQRKGVVFSKSLTQSRGHQIESFDNTKANVVNQNPSGINNIRESHGAPEALQQVRGKNVMSPGKLTQNFNGPSKNSQTLNYNEPSKLGTKHSLADSQSSQSQVTTSLSQNFDNFGTSGTNQPIDGGNRLTKSETTRQRHRNRVSNVAQPNKMGFSSKATVAPNPLPSIENQPLQQPETKQKLQQHLVDDSLEFTNVDSSYSNYESDEQYENENFVGTIEFTNQQLESTDPQVSILDTDLKPTSINGFTVPAISVLPLEYDHESSDLQFTDPIEAFSDSIEISDILDQQAISSIGTHQIVDPNNEYIPPAVEGPSFGEKISPENFNNHLGNSEKPSNSFSSSSTIEAKESQFPTATSNHEPFSPEILEGEISDSNIFQLYQTPTQAFQEIFPSQGQNQKKNVNEIQPYQPVIPKETPFEFEHEQILTELYESLAPSTATLTAGLSEINNNALPSQNTSPLNSIPGLNKQSHKITEQSPSQLSPPYHQGSSKLNQELKQSFNQPNLGVYQNINASNKNGYQPSRNQAKNDQSSQITNVNAFNSFQSPKEILSRPLTVSNKNTHPNYSKAKESVAEIYFVSPQFPNKQSQRSSYKNAPPQGVTQTTLNSNQMASKSHHSFIETSRQPIPGSKETNKFYEPPKQTSKPTNSAPYQSKGSLLTDNISKIGTAVLSQNQGSNQLNQRLQSDFTQMHQTPTQVSTLPKQPLHQTDQSTQVQTHNPSQSFQAVKHNAPQNVDNKTPSANVVLMKPIIKQLYQAPSEAGTQSLQTSSQNQNFHIQASHRNQIQSPHANIDIPNLSPKDISSYSSQNSVINPTHLEQPGSQNLPQSIQNFKFNGINKFSQAPLQNFKQLNPPTSQNIDHSLESSVKNQNQVESLVKSSSQALKNANQSPSADYQAPGVTKLWPTNQTFQSNHKLNIHASNLNNHRQPQSFQHLSSKQSQTPSIQTMKKEQLEAKTNGAPKQSQIQSNPVQKLSQQSSQISTLNHPSLHNFKQRPAHVQALQNHNKQSGTQAFTTQNKLNYNPSFQTAHQNLQQQIKTPNHISKSGQAQSLRTSKQIPDQYQTSNQNRPQQNPSQAEKYSNQFQSQPSVTSKQSYVQSSRLPTQAPTQKRNQMQNHHQPAQALKQMHQLQSFPSSKQTLVQSLPNPKPNPIQSYATSNQINPQQLQLQAIKQTQAQSPSLPSRLQNFNQAPKENLAQFNQLPNQTTYKPLGAGEIARNKPVKSNMPRPHLQNLNSRDKPIPKNSLNQFHEFGLKISNTGANSQQTSSYSSVPQATSKTMNGWSPMTPGMMY